MGEGGFRIQNSEANPGLVSFGERYFSAASKARRVGIKMSASLVWRTVLFFGLTAGYVILAALPYLA
jgi:hypothetical protein